MSANDELSLSANPYAAPISKSSHPQAAASESAEQRHLRAFVGSSANYYLGKWRRFVGHERMGFNWAAFLLAGFWIGYRKMYLLSMIFFAVILVETVAEEVVFVGILGYPETPAGLSLFVTLVAALVCGSYGNRWYLSHARHVIADVRTQGLEEQALIEKLSKRGGTSLASALGLFSLYMVVSCAALIILDILFYGM